MSSGLTEAQLRKIVEEVSRMSKARGENLNREEVKQILTELNLPPEMLDEALLRVKYREAVQRSHTSDRKLWIGVAVVLVAAAVVALLWWQQQQTTLAQVTAVQDRITLAQDNGGNLTVVDAQQGELFYRVTLNQAPVGRRLSLQCDWTNPAGVVVRQNRYETREITTPVWTTYCRLPLGSETTMGTWQVEMRLDNRVLNSTQFQVR